MFPYLPKRSGTFKLEHSSCSSKESCGGSGGTPDGRHKPGTPWRESPGGDISTARKLKGPGACCFPAHAISTKNKHLLRLVYGATHGFTVAVSVFRGTTPPKPLDCKIRLNTSGALFCGRWADPTGGEPRLSRAIFKYRSGDII